MQPHVALLLISPLAALLSPLVALRVSRWLDDRKERRGRQHRIFRSLMSTRSHRTSSEHVDALNLIDVDFYGSNTKERAVRDAWREYLDHLNNGSPAAIEVWKQRADELFISLLEKMAVCLDYDFNRVDLKRLAYSPRAHGDLENDQYELRKLTLAVLKGASALPIRPVITNEPTPKVPEARVAAPAEEPVLPKR